MEIPFARWENFRECELEMMETGHDEESAKKICGDIQARAEKGELYKGIYNGLDVLSKAKDKNLVVGGWASWEMRDADDDVVTTQAQVNFLKRLFQLPPEYRNITLNHGDFKIGIPLLKYVNMDGETFYSHVNEKGTYLISKIRNDNFKTTQMVREDILKGELRSYSISGLPLDYIKKKVDGLTLRYVTDVEPWATTLCYEAKCPKAANSIHIISKEKPRSDEERAKAHFNITDEEWNKLTEDQKKTLISKLPPRGAAQAAKKQKTGPTPGIEYDVVKITAVPNQIVLVERGKEISKAEIETIFAKHGFNKLIQKS